MQCSFCTEEDFNVVYRDVFHTVDGDFGPFDIAKCNHCGSAYTLNPPTSERLADFYQKYDDNRPQWYIDARDDNYLMQQYGFYSDFLKREVHGIKNPKWLDVGAGFGEIAQVLSNSAWAGKGAAIDIPVRPSGFPENVDYHCVDLNRDDWGKCLNSRFELVYSVAVWEHVLNSLLFAEQSLSVVEPGGTLVMICPAWDTMARRTFGKKWPYYNPGEHLSIPSLSGAEKSLQIASRNLQIETKIDVRHIAVGYNLRYVARVMGLKKLNGLVPNISMPLPTGMLAACVTVIE